MSKNKCISGKTFYGNEVSNYGQQEGYVDYETLAKSFNHVLCNDIDNVWDDSFELVNGNEYNEYDEPIQVMQYFIIDKQGKEILEDFTDELIWMIPRLNLYVWGVTHWGTGWDYCLTDIKINQGEKAWKKSSSEE